MIIESPPGRSDGVSASATVRPSLLRFSTAGSVDDGKSTLIGRLLFDSAAVPDDQLDAIAWASQRNGGSGLDLALLTDGLRAEREQKITIDVAYRYFQTERRKFIVADTPGHLQYTRNMVTGASNSELAVILLDARKGITTQSRRHGFIASLLRIPQIVVAVNKMDLIGYERAVFEALSDEYRSYSRGLGFRAMTFIPISALIGDNVVNRGPHMDWYGGPTLLEYLETVDVGADVNMVDFRCPVQCVLRPAQDFRGVAGRVVSGMIRTGEEIAALPSGLQANVTAIWVNGAPAQAASAGDSIVFTLSDELDIGRGDMMVRPLNLPTIADRFEAYLCWLSETQMRPEQNYVLRHTTRSEVAQIVSVRYRLDVETLHRQRATTLMLNEIGRVEVRVSAPLFFDPYQLNRGTGVFVLVDPTTNATVAAGMIKGASVDLRQAALAASGRPAQRVSPNVVAEARNIARKDREASYGHRACVVWLTGVPGAGKTSIARAVERLLFDRGCITMLLDGDDLRHGLNGDLGFRPADRRENIRRAAEVARLAFDHGAVVLCAFVSPYQEDRRRVRAAFPRDQFLEVHVHCSETVLRQRDPKGLYARAAAGTISDLTGVDAPYEVPDGAELRIDTTSMAAAEAARRLVAALEPVLWCDRRVPAAAEEQ